MGRDERAHGEVVTALVVCCSVHLRVAVAWIEPLSRRERTGIGGAIAQEIRFLFPWLVGVRDYRVQPGPYRVVEPDIEVAVDG